MKKFNFSKKLLLAITLLVFALGFTGSTVFSSVQKTMTPGQEGMKLNTIPAQAKLASTSGRYLVMFKQAPGNAGKDMVKGHGATVKRAYKLVPALAISSDAAAANAIANNPNVAFVEEDQLRYATADVQPWGIGAVKAPQAWPTTTGTGVKVCVIDTGIDYNHTDLDDLYGGGYDFVNDDSDPWDDAGHGTHCSGTIAAEANGSGVIGVAYNVGIYACKVLNAEGSGYVSDILAGVDWAVQNGMHIASLSLGGNTSSQTEEDGYQAAFDAGLLVVVASGNESKTKVGYPARYSSTIAVGAIDSFLNIAEFSNTGDNQEVVAPGVLVKSSVPVGTGFASYAQVDTTVYDGVGMEFSGTTEGITATAYYCNTGEAVEDFPAGVSGNIALILRGETTFAEKTTMAMDAGAVGVIIYNNLPGNFAGTLGEAGDWAPVISLSNEDGETLRLLGTPTLTLVNASDDFDYYDGTSMACPHVAGVAALIFAANPALTNVEVRSILSSSATDLGDAGWDSIFGNGLVNSEAAAAAAVNWGAGGDMYVSDIAMTLISQGSGDSARAVITILDDTSSPLSNAQVNISWSGLVSGTGQAVTGADGKVTFTSAKSRSTGTFTITVTGVSHASFTYNAALNVETSDSISN
ncbi:MAG: S8 family serine peptidase [Candidatus Aminicenantes bacterium]|nr:S8 family serine peptidase [Candidatus Aminicenantes bacterium]